MFWRGVAGASLRPLASYFLFKFGSNIVVQTSHYKISEIHVGYFIVAGARYGNITFTDELDFDVAELDIVYEDSDEGGRRYYSRKRRGALGCAS